MIGLKRWTSPPVLVAVLLAGCAGDPPRSMAEPTLGVEASAETPRRSPLPSLTASMTASAPDAADPVLIAAGDIAACDEEGDSATGLLIAELDGTVATLGDNVYPAGSDQTYAECYAPVWGSFRDRTRPAMGNHDVDDDGGAAYFRYFGDAAGTPGEGWYSYDLGDWHVVALNSNCGLVGCHAGSAQHAWLLDDLAASEARCTVAYWHHPRFSSGPHGDDPRLAPFWEALDDAGAELVLVGHDHLYERFFPQTAEGVADPEGVRQFTAGTGGKELYEAERVAPNSELTIDDTFGVLVLTLHQDGYDASFLAIDGTAADTPSGTCH